LVERRLKKATENIKDTGKPKKGRRTGRFNELPENLKGKIVKACEKKWILGDQFLANPLELGHEGEKKLIGLRETT